LTKLLSQRLRGVSLQSGINGGQMKHRKKPTAQQRKLIQQRKLNPADWMVERDTPEKIVLVHRHFDSVKREIQK
jgi:hypothetical protein